MILIEVGVDFFKIVINSRHVFFTLLTSNAFFLNSFFGFAASSFRLALWVRAIFYLRGCRSRIGTHSLKTTFEIRTLWKDARLMAGPYRLPGRQRWREMGPSLEAGEKDVFHFAARW